MEDLVPGGLPNSTVASLPLAYQTLDTLHILHVLEPVSWSLCLPHSLWSSCHSDHRSLRSERLTDLPWLFNLKMPLTSPNLNLVYLHFLILNNINDLNRLDACCIPRN